MCYETPQFSSFIFSQGFQINVTGDIPFLQSVFRGGVRNSKPLIFQQVYLHKDGITQVCTSENLKTSPLRCTRIPAP